MKNFQILTDKAAIGLSLACTIHCLASPLIIALLPSFVALQLNDEAFHMWMVFAVVPMSVYALTMGCRQHRRYHLLTLGLLGISCLILAIVLSEALLGETGEKLLTSLGAGAIAYGHYRNYRLCRYQEQCVCPEHSDKLSK